jgi:hypothetical protein
MSISIAIMAVSTGAAAVAALQLRHRSHRLLDAASGGQGHPLGASVLGRYIDEGGPSGVLGLPVSAERRATPGPSTPLGADREARFEHGTIYVDSAARCTKVVLSDDG